MAGEVHPGSWLGDSVEEFKKLPPWGKVAVGGIFVVVAYLGYSAYKNGVANSGSSQATTLPATSNAPGSSSPFSMVGNTPLLPSDVNPLYDPSGNLVAYQQGSSVPASAPTSSVPTSAPTPTQVGATPNPPSTNPVKAVAGYLGLLGPNAQVNIAKDGLASDSTYVNAQGQTVPLSSLIPGTDKVVQGSQNRVWYTDAGGQHLLTSGTGGAVDPTTNQLVSNGSTSAPAVTNQQNTQTTTNVNKSSGGAFESLQSRIRALTQLQSYTPQYGDNMNEVANKLGLKGGWRAFGVDSFQHGTPVTIPSAPAMPAMPAFPTLPGMQQSSQGQSINLPGISVHQSEQGQSIQAQNYSIQQGFNGQQIVRQS